MSEKHKKPRKTSGKARPSLLADWEAFEALQGAVYEAQGKKVPRIDF